MADKKIVIVGGGFAGVKAARQLSNKPGLKVTLISDKDYFCYFPTLYNSATGHPGSESSIPLEEIFAEAENVELITDRMTEIDPVRRRVLTQSGQTYAYHELILALGVVTSYFGIAGLEEFTFGVKSINEVEALKNHFHQIMVDDLQPDTEYVVIGAGPTGVELAAAMSTYLRQVVRLYRLRRRKINISLIEAAPRVLPRSHPKVSAKVERRLKKLGVKVMTGQKVEGATSESLKVNGKKILSQTVIWTAGVTNHPFFKDNQQHFTLSKNGKVNVDEYLSAAPHIYIAGDNAATPYSGLAQIAVHDGKFVADNALSRLNNQAQSSYKTNQPVTVVPVGHNWAVMEWKSIHISGYLGYLFRRAADLVGYWDVLPLGSALRLWLARHDHPEDLLAIDKKRKAKLGR